MPFFLVSWSLCIEEHFYLVMPVLVLGLTRYFKHPHILLVFACFPALFRFFSFYPPGDIPWGRHFTATHFRYEGLLLGVWASYVRLNLPAMWALLKKLSAFAVGPAFLLVVMAYVCFSGKMLYTCIYTLVAVFFLFLLVFVADRQPLFYSNSKAVFWIASTSYSIYLTHSFILDAINPLLKRMPDMLILKFFLAAGCIAFSGIIFYWCVEVPSLAVRHYLLPGRKSAKVG